MTIIIMLLCVRSAVMDISSDLMRFLVFCLETTLFNFICHSIQEPPAFIPDNDKGDSRFLCNEDPFKTGLAGCCGVTNQILLQAEGLPHAAFHLVSLVCFSHTFTGNKTGEAMRALSGVQQIAQVDMGLSANPSLPEQLLNGILIFQNAGAWQYPVPLTICGMFHH